MKKVKKIYYIHIIKLWDVFFKGIIYLIKNHILRNIIMTGKIIPEHI